VTVVQSNGRAPIGETALDATPRWLVAPDWALERALEEQPLADALYFGDGLIATRRFRRQALETECALVAFTLDPEDPLREAAAEREPDYALRGLYGKPLSGPDDLRLRLLARAPAAAINALRHVRDAHSDSLRASHAESQPDAVLLSLSGRDDDDAWALRERAWGAALDDSRAATLTGCVSERANSLRAKLFDKNPLVALSSLRATRTPLGDEWLAQVKHHAPKLVLTALSGRSDAFAHELRDELFETGREVVDTVRGLADERSFALRERALPRWPSTVLHSLLGLAETPRVRELRARCRELGSGDIHTLRREQLHAEAGVTTRARPYGAIAELAP